MKERNSMEGVGFVDSTPLSWVGKMQRRSKRKRTGSSNSSCSIKNPNKNKKKNVGGLKKSIVKPLDPTYLRPTPEECRLVRDVLMDFHGFPEEFVKYRHRRNHPDSVSGSSSVSSSQKLSISSASGLLNSNLLNEVVKLESVLDGDGDGFCCGESTSLNEEEGTQKESVLDGLVSTLLSQNTTEVNSRKAFLSLKSTFPTWEDVLAADLKCIENAIKCGGLAVTKAACINNLLTGLLERKGKLCLEHLRDMAVDDIKAELSGFKGIGPKTVACVLMFHLQKDDFPVDTHVFRITKAMGWVPSSFDREKAYLHLNERIPNELKFDLNCLLVTHGKLCQSCKSGEDQRKTSLDQPCPLSSYCCTVV